MTPEIETAFGEAWKAMAEREGNKGTVWVKPDRPKRRDRANAIIKYAKSHKEFTSETVHKKLGGHITYTRETLNELVKDGTFTRERTKGNEPYVYRRVE